jgi:hypothetical protein
MIAVLFPVLPLFRIVPSSCGRRQLSAPVTVRIV